RLLERVENGLALHRVQALLQRQARRVLRGGGRRDARGRKLEVVGLDLAPGAQRERALQHVLQLPHVPGKSYLRSRSRAASESRGGLPAAPACRFTMAAASGTMSSRI